MKWLSGFTGKKQQLKRRLFGYMLILATIVLVLLLSGLMLIGQFTGTNQSTFETLDLQTDVFCRQVEAYVERLATIGIRLSIDTTEAVEKYLSENQLDFSDINGSEENVAAVQAAIFHIIEQKLFETDCSGAFVVLDATVNTSTATADTSRTGLYLQRNSIDYSDSDILLYRGLSRLGKEHGIMTHRKWRLEFNTEFFPNYSELIADATLPLKNAYRISDIFTLAGTSERAMLMTLPLVGGDGAVYGLCGFEISESHFRQAFRQPSKLKHAVFTINRGSDSIIDHSDSFSCGITNVYYLSPTGKYTSSSIGSGLILFQGEAGAYIGVAKKAMLYDEEGDFTLTALIPKQDYDQWRFENILRIVLLVLLILTATIGCSYLFARRYLSPIKKLLLHLKQKEYDKRYGILEIDDLFAFLAEQDRLREAEFDEIRKAHDDTQTSLENIQSLHNSTMQQIDRLAYSRRDEVDPHDYENFKKGLHNLTEREKEIFDLYIAGNNVKEIMDQTGLKESTIRFHNKNIYSKLGVHSLKQLLRYSAILNKTEKP